MTARLEFLLDEVLVGKQQAEAAIDAVCEQAARIIGRLVASGAAAPLPGNAATGAALPGIALPPGAARPPSPAMRKFIEDLAARLKLKPPSGYTKSAEVCRGFLDRHAPKRPFGRGDATPAPSAAQRAFAETIARNKGIAVPDEAKANTRALSAWIDANRNKVGRKPSRTRPGPASRVSSKDASAVAAEGTALAIPFGNKEAALRLGARYNGAGWLAPPGTDLGPFRERGWL
ncbi:MAG: hypothetical protein ICV73_22310 [Acetobacteraceae bacterium]|nr:hypothetical protein [Acetobacteraceae bacterium]